jgi:hypothetical protein
MTSNRPRGVTSPMALDNAAISIETCRSILSQLGHHKAAEALRGFDFIDPAAAALAKGLLSAIPVYGPIAETAKAEALDALEQALAESWVRHQDLGS